MNISDYIKWCMDQGMSKEDAEQLAELNLNQGGIETDV